MMVPIEKVFLRNQNLQRNPNTQRESPFYQKVRDSIKKRGMINPLLCIQEGDRYKCCIGNNRYLAALELGYKKVPVKVITSEVPNDMMKETMKYIPTEAEGYPSRARAYEANKK
jgi:ParB-like chromosome segregation protein Spo0J